MTTIMNLELYSLYVFTMNEMTLKIHYFKRFEVLARVSNQTNNALKKKYVWITFR